MNDFLELKRKECYEQNSVGDLSKATEKFCKLVFDGIMCWNVTKANTVAKQPCPSYITVTNKHATKKCDSNGEWYINKNYNTTWTNYSLCWKIIDEQTALIDIDTDLENFTFYQEWFPFIKNICHWGYAISLIALILAMIIFLSIKKLQCARNRLHMHLFMSFILRAFMYLLKDILLVDGVAMQSDLVVENSEVQYINEHSTWICKTVISFRNYFIVANYMLILMEGIYLHNLMFLTPFADKNKIIVYYMLGWGLPLLFIIPWVIVRTYYEDTLCWTTSTNINFLMIINAPIIASVLINFILFIMIVHILLVKLNSMYIQRKRSKYGRLLRSTLVLVPLFGVPYTITLIMSFTANKNKIVEVIWLFVDQTFIAFQGFFVALIYCLLNSEVHREIKQKLVALRHRQEHFRRSRRRTISRTQQYSVTFLP